MPFLSSKLMQEKQEAIKIAPHPLLAEKEVALSVKMSYVQGCVMGTLQDDDKISADERQQVSRIGLSLGLSADEVAECFTAVTQLAENDKGAFLDGLKDALNDPVIAKFFVADLEEVVKKNGQVPEPMQEFLAFMRTQLAGALVEDPRPKFATVLKAILTASEGAVFTRYCCGQIHFFGKDIPKKWEASARLQLGVTAAEGDDAALLLACVRDAKKGREGWLMTEHAFYLGTCPKQKELHAVQWKDVVGPVTEELEGYGGEYYYHFKDKKADEKLTINVYIGLRHDEFESMLKEIIAAAESGKYAFD